jgi:predicted TIM-barrel fold metal-dependent hydrolase
VAARSRGERPDDGRRHRNLQPDKPEFKEYLDRYRKNKLFLGIRYGNLWNYNLVEQVGNPTFIEGLKLMQQADLAMDSANPRPDLLAAVLRVNDKVPGLRIIVDHLPAMMRRVDASALAAVEPNLRELAKRPTICIEVSELMRVEDGKPSTDPAVYKPLLDCFFETFGEDEPIFGSDWPNGQSVAEKYFWKNSLAAYKWLRRDPSQPQLAGPA